MNEPISIIAFMMFKMYKRATDCFIDLNVMIKLFMHNICPDRTNFVNIGIHNIHTGSDVSCNSGIYISQ